MKRIVNLIFDRIERVLWFRHLLWTLRENGNTPTTGIYNATTNSFYEKDIINKESVIWLRKHLNDYLNSGDNGSATGTVNSTDVAEDKV